MTTWLTQTPTTDYLDHLNDQNIIHQLEYEFLDYLTDDDDVYFVGEISRDILKCELGIDQITDLTLNTLYDDSKLTHPNPTEIYYNINGREYWLIAPYTKISHLTKRIRHAAKESPDFQPWILSFVPETHSISLTCDTCNIYINSCDNLRENFIGVNNLDVFYNRNEIIYPDNFESIERDNMLDVVNWDPSGEFYVYSPVDMVTAVNIQEQYSGMTRGSIEKAYELLKENNATIQKSVTDIYNKILIKQNADLAVSLSDYIDINEFLTLTPHVTKHYGIKKVKEIIDKYESMI